MRLSCGMRSKVSKVSLNRVTTGCLCCSMGSVMESRTVTVLNETIHAFKDIRENIFQNPSYPSDFRLAPLCYSACWLYYAADGSG